MSQFIPESEQEKDKSEKVPYIEDVKSKDGIAGHATKRSIEELKSLCREAMGKIGGAIINFQTGRIEGLWKKGQHTWSISTITGSQVGSKSQDYLPELEGRTGCANHASTPSTRFGSGSRIFTTSGMYFLMIFLSWATRLVGKG